MEFEQAVNENERRRGTKRWVVAGLFVVLLLAAGGLISVAPVAADNGDLTVELDDPPDEINQDDDMEFEAVFSNSDNESIEFFHAYYVEGDRVNPPVQREVDAGHTRVERISATNDDIEDAIGEELQPGESYAHEVVVYEDDDWDNEIDSASDSFDVAEEETTDPTEAIEVLSYDPADRYVESFSSRSEVEMRNTGDEELQVELVATIDGDEVGSSVRPIDDGETVERTLAVNFGEAQEATDVDLTAGNRHSATIEVYHFDPHGDPQRGEFLGQQSHRIEGLSFSDAFETELTEEPQESAQVGDALPFEVAVDANIPEDNIATIDVDVFVDDVRVTDVERRVSSDRARDLGGEFSIAERENLDSTSYDAGDEIPYRIRTIARTDDNREELDVHSGSVELIGDVDATFADVEISDPIVRGDGGEIAVEVVNTGEDTIEAEFEYGAQNRQIGSTSVTIPQGEEQTVRERISVDDIESATGSVDDEESVRLQMRLRETVTDPDRGAVLDRSADRVQVFGSPEALYSEQMSARSMFMTGISGGEDLESGFEIENEHGEDVSVEVSYSIDGETVMVEQSEIDGSDRIHRERLELPVEEFVEDGIIEPGETHEQSLEIQIVGNGESVVLREDDQRLEVEEDVGAVEVEDESVVDGVSLPDSSPDIGSTDEVEDEDREEAQQQRGFLTNDPDSSMAVLDDPFALTMIGFFVSILSMIYPMVRQG